MSSARRLLSTSQHPALPNFTENGPGERRRLPPLHRSVCAPPSPLLYAFVLVGLPMLLSE